MAGSNNTAAPIVPARLDWPSVIGNFILNFGTLDWHLTVFLEARLPDDVFATVKGMYFQDRVKRIKVIIQEASEFNAKQPEFNRFFEQLEKIRLLRNQIAHGQLCLKVSSDGKTADLILTQPKDLDGSEQVEARPLKLHELVAAMTELNALIEEFQRLSGDWREDPQLNVEVPK